MLSSVSCSNNIIKRLCLTNDLAKKTKAKKILRSLASTSRLRAEVAPATAALSFSLSEKRRMRHSTDLYSEFSRDAKRANFKVSRLFLPLSL